MKPASVVVVVLSLVLAGCVKQEAEVPLSLLVHEYDFSDSDHGWIADFAELPADEGKADEFQVNAAYTDDLSEESVISRRSYMLSGNNISGELFMYVKRKVTGLKANTNYTVTFNVDLASQLNMRQASGSVFLKAGATHTEPKSVIEDGYYRLNIDKGEYNQSGEDMILLGDIFEGMKANNYLLLNLNNTMANSRYVARTNNHGDIWLVVGIDSNARATTTVFLRKIQVVFSAS